MFTCSAITPPEVNGFGWNLGNSKSIVWSCPDKFWARSAQKRQREGEPKFFFGPLNNSWFHRLPVGQISRNLHKKTCFHVLCGAFGKHLWKFARKGSFFPKKTSILASSKSTISDFRPQFLQNDYKSWKVMTGWHACGMLAFHWHCWNELKVIPLACNPHTRRAIFPQKYSSTASMGDDFSACCITQN